MLCAYFRWFSRLSLRLVNVPKASQCASVTFVYNTISWRSHGVSNFAAKAMRLHSLLRRRNSSEYCALAAAPSIVAAGSSLLVEATEVRQESLLIQRETWQQKLDTGFKLNLDIIRGCAPIADKDVHSFNDSKKILSHLPRQREQECLCHAPAHADSPGTIVKMLKNWTTKR